MSIINQALKKAQREQLLRDGTMLPSFAQPQPSPRRRWRRWLLPGGFLLVGGIGVGLYTWLFASSPHVGLSERDATLQQVAAAPSAPPTAAVVPQSVPVPVLSRQEVRRQRSVTAPALPQEEAEEGQPSPEDLESAEGSPVPTRSPRRPALSPQPPSTAVRQPIPPPAVASLQSSSLPAETAPPLRAAIAAPAAERLSPPTSAPEMARADATAALRSAAPVSSTLSPPLRSLPPQATAALPPPATPPKPPLPAQEAAATVPQERTKAQTLFNRALGAKAKGDLKRAKTLLEQAITLDPTAKGAYDALGSVYYQQQQYQRAVTMYERALAIDPNYVTARNNLGSAYMQLALDERAIAELQRAVQVDSSYSLAYYNLACVHARAGRGAAAAQYLAQAVALEPEARQWAQTDADFAPVRSVPEVRKLLEQ